MVSPSATPLGIRNDIALSTDQLCRLWALDTYDLERVRQRLLRDALIPSTWVDAAILEFRRYLGLHVVAPGDWPMYSRPVDEVWHCCLLFSRLYTDLCLRIFGAYLHHDPASEDHPIPASRWLAFRAAYAGLYGDLHWLWLPARPPEGTA